jgi:hypothetical protein
MSCETPFRFEEEFETEFRKPAVPKQEFGNEVETHLPFPDHRREFPQAYAREPAYCATSPELRRFDRVMPVPKCLTLSHEIKIVVVAPLKWQQTGCFAPEVAPFPPKSQKKCPVLPGRQTTLCCNPAKNSVRPVV